MLATGLLPRRRFLLITGIFTVALLSVVPIGFGQRAVNIYTDYPSVVINEGKELSLDLHLTNAGEQEEEVLLSVEGPDGWNARFVVRLNQIPDRESGPLIDDALESVGLADVADRPVRTYSRGMRQRLGIAEVLLKEPRLAILDEPRGRSISSAYRARTRDRSRSARLKG